MGSVLLHFSPEGRAVLILVLVGFFTAAIMDIASIVLQILTAVAANRGEGYRYPMTIRFIN